MVVRQRLVSGKPNPSSDVKLYLKRKKWSYYDSDDQCVVKTCPYCGDTQSHFYINSVTSQFICFKCDIVGNLYKLKKDLGDIVPVVATSKDSGIDIKPEKYNKIRKKIVLYHKTLLKTQDVLKVVQKTWGYKLESIKKFKLGVQSFGGKLWLVIPYFEDGKLVNAKMRSLPPSPKKFRRVKGMKSALFNIDSVDEKLGYLILCEGESDVISLDGIGVRNVVGVSVGARGFKAEWYDFVNKFKKVYIVYDNDVVGQDGAKKAALRLGSSICWNVSIPPEVGNDATNFVMSGKDLSDVTKLLGKASLFDVDDVLPFSSALSNLEADLTFNRYLDSSAFVTPWKKVNKLIGGLIPGDLVVVSGVAKVGKTTWALNLLLYHALLGVPVLNYCLEMRPERIIPKIISYFRFVERKDIVRDDVIFVKTLYGKKPFYMAHSYSFTMEQVFDTIRESVKRYGIELLVFDHLHFLIRSLTNTTAEVSNAVREFKLLAEELRIPIVLIVQPKKLSGKNARPTINDLRDSSSIGQDADTVCIIHRKRVPDNQKDRMQGDSNSLFEPETSFFVEATRYNPGGVTQLYFDGALSRYFNSRKEWISGVKNKSII